MRTERISKWVIAVPMALLALATIYPVLFTANVAFKSRREYVLDRFAVAESFGWDNFATAWTEGNMLRGFLNTTLILAVSLAGTVLVVR